VNISITLTDYYSRGDEDRFFAGLDSIAAVTDYKGVVQQLILEINEQVLDNAMLRELIALLTRYNIDLTPLSVLANNKDFEWISEPRYY